MLNPLNCFGRFLLATPILLVASAGSTIAEPLPPPPSADQSQQQNRQEYEFKAPSTPVPNSPSDSKAGSTTDRLYRVQINNTSYVSLFLVRGVEPDAFIPEEGNIIQAGLFSKQSNAKQLMQTLSQRGIDAEIVPVSGSEAL